MRESYSNRLVVGIVFIVGVLLASPAYALLINDSFNHTASQTFQVSIYYADPLNRPGLSVGDVMTGSILFDNTYIPDSGSYRIELYKGQDSSIYNADELQWFSIVSDYGDALRFTFEMAWRAYIDFLDGSVIGLHCTESVNKFSWEDTVISGADYSAFGHYETPNGPVRWDVKGTVDYSVPEPATMLLFGSGITGLGIMRRRFKV